MLQKNNTSSISAYIKTSKLVIPKQISKLQKCNPDVNFSAYQKLQNFLIREAYQNSKTFSPKNTTQAQF
jgi:hypothetical protein